MQADTPYLLWFELREAFERVYEESPRGELLIRRIYQYSDWCCSQPRGKTAEDNPLTCVAVCFYEHIPTHTAAREDMPAGGAQKISLSRAFSSIIFQVRSFGNCAASWNERVTVMNRASKLRASYPLAVHAGTALQPAIRRHLPGVPEPGR